MAHDPAIDLGAGAPPEQRQALRIAALERRIRALERSNTPNVLTGTGAPTVLASTLTNGTRYIDLAGTGRLYFVVAGAWRSVALA